MHKKPVSHLFKQNINIPIFITNSYKKEKKEKKNVPKHFPLAIIQNTWKITQNTWKTLHRLKINKCTEY